MTTRAVILARGLGTRMRQADSAAPMSGDQAAMASTGVKALIPIGRPFLDYVLSALADAGVHRICLVIGPEHDLLRRRYSVETTPTRLTIEFAVQPEPRGTADAVLAAESWTSGEPFLVINSDNYYPPDALRPLAALDEPGLVRVQPCRPARRWTDRRLSRHQFRGARSQTATTCDGLSKSLTHARSTRSVMMSFSA